MRSSNHASALVVCALALAMACTSVTQNSPRDARVADCQLVHSGGPYGENLFWGTGRDFTLTDAVCRHYKQVVW
ncbi:hypothetical protein B296_00013022 [Ensete ventricosum]|uniref:Uncharacterized protein n=1 Tax=Ensete ventricosum TaxID=4639 RepID=A0A426Z6F4_ENSVE|nr:hypothetical protein B296_00013022 [Ensete ventricosum]